jgi:nucleoside-diphosphate-sugar epimerase
VTVLHSALILGASGRIGRMLRHHGLTSLSPVWQYRQPAACSDTLIFDPLHRPGSLGHFDTVLCLSGVISGSPAALRNNSALAEAALDIGAACGAAQVFLASTAAVYGPAPVPLSETLTLHPLSDYGRAKAEMEDRAQTRAAQLNLPVTILRIGNVAGADALLGQPVGAPITLDRFPDGQGPRRSYIGPGDLAAVLEALLRAGAAGQALPAVLNLALPGPVAMADLLRAAGRRFDWQPAPDRALPIVDLDTSRLSGLIPLPEGSASRIVADWQSFQQVWA